MYCEKGNQLKKERKYQEALIEPSSSILSMMLSSSCNYIKTTFRASCASAYVLKINWAKQEGRESLVLLGKKQLYFQ